MGKDFLYVCSSELDVALRIRVVSLFGHVQKHDTYSGEMFLKLTLYCNQRKVGREVCTAYKAAPAQGSNNRELQRWNEWIQLPLTYSELPRDALIHLTLWDVGNDVEPFFIAQASKYLFSKRGVLRDGQFDVRLQKAQPKETPEPKFDESSDASKLPKTSGIREYIKKEKMYKQNYIDRVDWLDQFTFSKLEQIKEEARVEDRALYISLEMATVYGHDGITPFQVIYYVPDTQNEGILKKIRGKVDPELGMENLCETKHHMLTRNARAGDIDKRLQPNAMIKDMLESIIRMPSSQPITIEERDIIWKFRFWLKNNPHALTKFARSVNWDEGLEVKQAIEVLSEFLLKVELGPFTLTGPPIDACDALELLGPSFTHPFVRRYAVSRLQNTPPSILLLYLPQLVQSIRYEAHVNMDMKKSMECVNADGGEDPLELSDANLSDQKSSALELYLGRSEDMVTYLINQACQHAVIANFLYWYLKVEVEANETTDPYMSNYYTVMLERLLTSLQNGSSLAKMSRQNIMSQRTLVDALKQISKEVQSEGGNRQKKLDFLKRKLAHSPELMDLKGLPLPLDPTIQVKNVQPETTVLFASKLMPMRLTFSTVRGFSPPYECGEAYMTIFKRGDDLRQDQLVLQMIKLMDNLWKDEKLDLCLTPYAVLATSVSDGFVQFVKATPIADLRNIQDTLRQYRPSATGPYGIEAAVMENYVRSCAGYSIICYVLGIGDRHMHNLLLRENGRMFHVDFGYILGRDPKPMPPLIKLTTEMVNCMGGQESVHFKRFIDYCTTAFCIIRRHANLIINLFSLMLDAGIPDVAVEKDKAVQTILERFHLQLTDEEAYKEITRIIYTSLSAKIPIIADFVHDVKQYIVN
ncbi:unnamed protein product [Bursaphelenchus okinawaensis]|uniref:Phosphatidylinositol 3-kinase catalytic subunit type 3 n=1 Tax=Bursaphelenchus okinawaensis TaxID=465554 RepID=A0A811JQH9_9BILA|nr:unnamed protein product [Bursaphelenchus okinawaensis]CAG9078038.1 unnamed protein product [Bursaphelenchus okinawaensis]